MIKGLNHNFLIHIIEIYIFFLKNFYCFYNLDLIQKNMILFFSKNSF